jgi:hypothetical protein
MESFGAPLSGPSVVKRRLSVGEWCNSLLTWQRRAHDGQGAYAKSAPHARSLRRCFVLVAASVSLLIAPSCSEGGGGGVTDVLGDLQREEFRLSLLTLNLRGHHEEWAVGLDEENGPFIRVPWRERYSRIADWMAAPPGRQTQITPDLLVLEEVWGKTRCAFQPFPELRDYDTLFELISRIKARTGVTYRIAYLVGKHTLDDSDCRFAGNAALYKPERLRNTTPRPSTETVADYNSRTVTGTHRRRSFPCDDPTQAFRDLEFCALIDEGGAWAGSYQVPNGKWSPGLVFARFDLARQPGFQIHLYNIHHDVTCEREEPPGPCAQPHAEQAVRDFIQQIESRFGDSRLYPPIVAGDFNTSRDDMIAETTESASEGGLFAEFEIGAFSRERDDSIGDDPIGVLLGETSAFEARFAGKIDEALVLPTYGAGPGSAELYCGEEAVLWSDHCGVFVRMSPY